MNKKNTWIMFVKAPRLGMVKTRFQPQLTPEQALALYRAMAEDLVAKFRKATKFDLQIHFWPPDGGEEIRQWLGDDLVFTPQQEGDLGWKMHRAFAYAFQQGYRKAVIIGSDLPMLNQFHIQEAFWQLETHDAVLGPTDDGGYYLIALKTLHPELFADVSWSTEQVFSQTMENARRANLRIALLKKEADLDTFPDVRKFWGQLHQPEAAIDQSAIPRTYKVLAELFVKKR
jgi:rSAM/selenodomain-associated transferase 1